MPTALPPPTPTHPHTPQAPPDCHSTALTKGFDAATNTFRTQFAETSVGCEACHGPGAAHSETPAEFPVVSLRDPDIRLAVCGSCHSRRSQIAEGFVPGKPLLDHYEPSLLDEGLYFADGQILDEVFVYGSFLQSKMHNAGVSCGDCHEPHAGQPEQFFPLNPFQIFGHTLPHNQLQS